MIITFESNIFMQYEAYVNIICEYIEITRLHK